jgi:hypothetical protein
MYLILGSRLDISFLSLQALLAAWDLGFHVDDGLFLGDGKVVERLFVLSLGLKGRRSEDVVAETKAVGRRFLTLELPDRARRGTRAAVVLRLSSSSGLLVDLHRFGSILDDLGERLLLLDADIDGGLGLRRRRPLVDILLLGSVFSHLLDALRAFSLFLLSKLLHLFDNDGRRRLGMILAERVPHE